ncbi:extracellular solute-binding protein [Microbacterium sp. H1-D42]|uniref:ABC transporter substrate-binding protein n=1 Tax=Microbacterium sp. H1-D42 TaxID=2925844 RepID=UPI001F532EF2|nr:extracellular solute-binding protein [Microbacterium sp. H1-D42]UNK70460.1 extracellular solute-binding protein [Microbacterium sp. H1-D42]
MKRSRILGLAALGATAALAMTGCSTTAPTEGAGAGGDVELTFMTFETPAVTAAFWDKSIAAAEAEVDGVTIKRIVTPDPDRNAYAKKLQATNQFPDLLASISPKDFEAAGLLKPFDQDWLDENFVLPRGAEINGKTYVPPTNAQVLPLVYYNKTIFAENDIEVPEDYDGFVEAVGQLKDAGVTPIEIAGAEPWAASMPIVALASADVMGGNPDWIKERYEGKTQFVDTEFVDAMQKYVDLIDQGAFSAGALSVDFATANSNFLDGKSGMYIMGSWFTGSGYITPEQADNLGAFPLPTEDGKVVVPFNVGGTTAVSATSKNVDKAMEFAKAWSLAPSSLEPLVEGDGSFPLMKNLTMDDFDVKVNSVFEATYPLVTDDNLKVAAFGWVNDDNSLAPGMNDKFYALSQSFFSNKDVKAQLATLDTEWDKVAK